MKTIDHAYRKFVNITSLPKGNNSGTVLTFLGTCCDRYEWWDKQLLVLLALGYNDPELELQKCEVCESLISSTLFTSGEEGIPEKNSVGKTKIIVQNDAV